MVYVLRIALNLRQGVPDFKAMGRRRIDMTQKCLPLNRTSMSYLRCRSQMSDNSPNAQRRRPLQNRILRYLPRATPAGSFRLEQRLGCDSTWLIKKNFAEHAPKARLGTARPRLTWLAGGPEQNSTKGHMRHKCDHENRLPLGLRADYRRLSRHGDHLSSASWWSRD